MSENQSKRSQYNPYLCLPQRPDVDLLQDTFAGASLLLNVAQAELSNLIEAKKLRRRSRRKWLIVSHELRMSLAAAEQFIATFSSQVLHLWETISTMQKHAQAGGGLAAIASDSRTESLLISFDLYFNPDPQGTTEAEAAAMINCLATLINCCKLISVRSQTEKGAAQLDLHVNPAREALHCIQDMTVGLLLQSRTILRRHWIAIMCEATEKVTENDNEDEG